VSISPEEIEGSSLNFNYTSTSYAERSWQKPNSASAGSSPHYIVISYNKQANLSARENEEASNYYLASVYKQRLG